MSVLIIAEHNNQHLNPATLHAVTAAAKLGNVDWLLAAMLLRWLKRQNRLQA